MSPLKILHHLAERLLRLTVRIFFTVLFSLKGRPEVTPEMEKTVALYKGEGFAELFTQIRLWDAPLQEVERLAPGKGIIVDLGCGDGFLVNYLALAQPKRRLVGIEIDKERLTHADKGLPNTKFIKGNILREEFPTADAILLVHVLHHLPSYSGQEVLLKRCHKKLREGGRLIIAEVARRPLLKYIFSWLTDAVIVPILFENKLFSNKFFYRDSKDWANILDKAGFSCKIIPAQRGKPFSHIILECQKKN